MNAPRSAGRVKAGGLQVDANLYEFINREALPGSGVSKADFWKGFGEIVHALAPRNRKLLDKRDRLQALRSGRTLD